MSLLRVAQSFANLLAAPRSGKPHGTKKVPPPNLDSRLTPVPRLPWDFDAMHMASLDAEGEERERAAEALPLGILMARGGFGTEIGVKTTPMA